MIVHILSLNDDDDDAKALPTGVPKDDAMKKGGWGGQNVSKSDGVILVCSLIADCCHPPGHLSGAAEEKLMGTLAEVPSSPPPNKLDKHQSPETLSSHTASATDKSSAVYWHRK